MIATENFFNVVIEIDIDSLETFASPIKVGMSSMIQFQSDAEPLGHLLVRRIARLANQVRQSGN